MVELLIADQILRKEIRYKMMSRLEMAQNIS